MHSDGIFKNLLHASWPRTAVCVALRSDGIFKNLLHASWPKTAVLVSSLVTAA